MNRLNAAILLVASRRLRRFSTVLLSLTCFAALSGASAGREPLKPHLVQWRIEHLGNSILAFDIADGSDLAAAALSNLHVRIWSLRSGQVVHELSFPTPETDVRLRLDVYVEPISLHFSSDGTIPAVGFLNEIHLYDVQTWAEKRSLGIPGEDKLRPGKTPTPETPVLKHRTPDEARAQINTPEPTLDEETKARFDRIAKGDGRTRILNFAFAEEGPSIIAAYCRGDCYFWLGRQTMSPTGNDPVRLWDMRSGTVSWERFYDSKGVISRIAAPEGDGFIAVDSELGRCAVGAYGLRDGQPHWSRPFGPCDRSPEIALLPGGRTFITNRIEEGARKNAFWRKAAVYDVATGAKIADLPNSEGVRAMDASHDGRFLVSINWKGTSFQVWNLEARKVVINRVPEGWKRSSDRVLDQIRLSPDNRWLVVGSSVSGDIAVYRFRTDNQVRDATGQ